MNPIDYDKWYSLQDIGKLFNCDWEYIPEESNGCVKQQQLFKLRGRSAENAGSQKEIFNFETGEFPNGCGTNTTYKDFQFIRTRVVDQRGVI